MGGVVGQIRTDLALLRLRIVLYFRVDGSTVRVGFAFRQANRYNREK